MCNLYSHTAGPQAILEFTRAMVDRTANLQPQPGIFPDYMAPIVRNTADGHGLTVAPAVMAFMIFNQAARVGRAADILDVNLFTAETTPCKVRKCSNI